MKPDAGVEAAGKRSASPAHALVADEEIAVRELVREILGDSGYRVTTAASAAETERRLRADRPDVVLLDLSLPDRGGLALLRSWASAGRLAVPVVAVSARASIENAVEAMRLGVSDFLEKPLALDKLLAAVKRAASGPAAAEHEPLPAAPQWLRGGIKDLVQWPQALFALPYREAHIEFERAYFLHALARQGGTLTEVAARTGLERTHLYRKIKGLGLRSTLKRK